MLSSSALHSVRAMIALASQPPGTFVGSPAVAKQVGAPANYLGKLLQTLARADLVVSQKGLGGGWSLGKDAASISLLDIVTPIEDVARWRSCILGRAECSDGNPCHVHDSWGPVRDAFLTFMTQTTLQQLVDEGGVERLVSRTKRA